MTTETTVGAIPEDVARRLCDEVRADHRGKWWRWTAWWCWGCVTFTKGEPTKRCWYDPPRNRGCAQVNQRYERG